MAFRFRDRAEAGQVLAEKLRRYSGLPNAAVLALPRGGVPVAYEVARRLGAPLDVFLVRKLGVPWQEELAFGALASGGTKVIDWPLVRQLGLTETEIQAIIARELAELERRERAYRHGRPALDVSNRVAILIDDGLATGSTMLAAVRALRALRPAQVVVAVPVAPPSTCDRLRSEADEVVCAYTPEPFWAVGAWYEDFTQTTDEEVRTLLAHAEVTDEAP
ncbi:MAG TPA: phosphoribosyltransferase [Bryobacteraceae bacterium]|jgi:predicted phosphoribosyltransferase|nr:phosphoribosyltransferase [Bryobacteraceae bacterium]